LILFDANILIYAYHSRSESHVACRDFLEKTVAGTEAAAICWQSILAFLRIGTNPRVFARPLPRAEASAIISVWLNHPSIVLLEPGERYWKILSDLLDEARVTGPLVTDAALAALALEHGSSLCTTDRDFARFSTLRTIDPTR
jgi:toxin-antitoxin system PIN domain toxin